MSMLSSPGPCHLHLLLPGVRRRIAGHGHIGGTLLAASTVVVNVLHVQIDLQLALGRLKEVVEALKGLNVPLIARQLVQVDLLVRLKHTLHAVLLLLGPHP